MIAPSPLSAQLVQGRVLESATELPVTQVELRLVDETGELHGLAASDDTGAFLLGTEQPGRYRIQASRLGLETVTTEPLELTSGRVREVIIRMDPDVIPLEPLEVVGERMSQLNRATYDGLYQRRARSSSVGSNRVWTQGDPELDQALSVAEFLAEHAPLLTRGGPFLEPRDPDPDITRRRGVRVDPDACYPYILYRGTEPSAPARALEEGWLDLRVYELEGIEVYRNIAEAPLGLRPGGLRNCGVIVIWPRRMGDEPW